MPLGAAAPVVVVPLETGYIGAVCLTSTAEAAAQATARAEATMVVNCMLVEICLWVGVCVGESVLVRVWLWYGANVVVKKVCCVERKERWWHSRNLYLFLHASTPMCSRCWVTPVWCVAAQARFHRHPGISNTSCHQNASNCSINVMWIFGMVASSANLTTSCMRLVLVTGELASHASGGLAA